MKTTKENDKLIITLNARIDTENAAETDKELSDMLKENPGFTPILDASELNYISSAGLRVLMKLRKTTGKALTVRNVSPEVYEIFDTTGFTGILDVKKAPRKNAFFIKIKSFIFISPLALRFLITPKYDKIYVLKDAREWINT